MDIKGTIVEIRPTEAKGVSNFQVRTFVIEVQNNRDTRYNDFLEFQLTGQRCVMLDCMRVGQLVNVAFDIRGRKWTGKENQIRYFNSLVAWNIVLTEQQSGNAQTTPDPLSYQTDLVDLDFSASPTDNNPF